MSTTRFNVHEHVIPAGHIRGYPRATSGNEEEVLQLAVKQYTPHRDAASGQTSVTIIGAHANGFPKELYEPLWDVLFDRLQTKNVHIRSIWIADVAWQGQSGVLNEAKIGNDPNWIDHSRDLLLMTNHFRQHIHQPIIGIGHSMGGVQLTNLALMHPRLFTTLILIDPVIFKDAIAPGGGIPAKASAARRDRWSSRRVARKAFLRSKFYQIWDSRVFDKWVEFGLRELPTALYKEADASATGGNTDDKEVTLVTTKHQEVFSFLRARFPTPEYPEPWKDGNPYTHFDNDPVTMPNSIFYRPETVSTFHQLPHLLPSVLYLFGDQSHISHPKHIADRMAYTGSGVGGSGGAEKGRVTQHTFKGVGHLIPMEVVDATADVSADWIVPELERWRKLAEADAADYAKIPPELRSQMSEEFKKNAASNWSVRPKNVEDKSKL